MADVLYWGSGFAVVAWIAKILWNASQGQDGELFVPIRPGPRASQRGHQQQLPSTWEVLSDLIPAPIVILVPLIFVTLLVYWLLPDFYTYYSQYSDGYKSRQERAHQMVMALEKQKIVRVDRAQLIWISSYRRGLTATVTNTGSVPVYDASVSCEFTALSSTRKRENGRVIQETQTNHVSTDRNILRLLPGEIRTIALPLSYSRDDTDGMQGEFSTCTVFYTVHRNDIIQMME